MARIIAIAAVIALPTVILAFLYGQSRIFLVMARDGLLPEGLSKVHPKWRTPYVVTAITGVLVAIAAAFLPVGQLADIANAGTLYAFLMVAVSVMMLRKTAPDRQRAFKVPALMIIGPLTIFGCIFLFFNLPAAAMMVLPIWTVIGFAVYFGYSRHRSHLGRGIVEVHEEEAHDLAPHLPGVDDPAHRH